jgi:hypothetical protein
MDINEQQILTDEQLAAISTAYVGDSDIELEQFIEWATLLAVNAMTFALVMGGRVEVGEMRNGEPVFKVRGKEPA